MRFAASSYGAGCPFEMSDASSGPKRCWWWSTRGAPCACAEAATATVAIDASQERNGNIVIAD